MASGPGLKGNKAGVRPGHAVAGLAAAGQRVLLPCWPGDHCSSSFVPPPRWFQGRSPGWNWRGACGSSPWGWKTIVSGLGLRGTVCPEFGELGTLERECQIHAFPVGPTQAWAITSVFCHRADGAVFLVDLWEPLSLAMSSPPKKPSSRITYFLVSEKLALFM